MGSELNQPNSIAGEKSPSHRLSGHGGNCHAQGCNPLHNLPAGARSRVKQKISQHSALPQLTSTVQDWPPNCDDIHAEIRPKGTVFREQITKPVCAVAPRTAGLDWKHDQPCGLRPNSSPSMCFPAIAFPLARSTPAAAITPVILDYNAAT